MTAPGDPLFTAQEARRYGLDLVVNDIDAGELALTPEGLRTAHGIASHTFPREKTHQRAVQR